MWRAGFAGLISHWRRKPLQLLTLLVGLALATALWSGVQAINAEARASYANAAQSLGERRFAQALPAQGDRIAQSDYIALRRAGWLVSPLLEGRPALDRNIRVIGIDPMTVPVDFGPGNLAAPNRLVGFLTPPGQIHVHPEHSETFQDAGPEIIPNKAVPPGIAFTDIAIAQRLLDQPGAISRLIVLPDQRSDLPDFNIIARDLTLRAPQDGSDISRLTDSFHLNLTAFGLLSFAVGMFIVHGAIGLAFEQRRPIFRTLRALGLPLHVLVSLIAVELLALALLAGVIGMALGYLIAAALLPDVAATLRGLYGAEVDGSLSLRASWWFAGLFIAVLGTALAAASAMVKLVRLPLLAPAQPRAWARASEKRMRFLGLSAFLLFGLGIATLNLASGLVAGFITLGAILIAAALALPVLLHQLLNLAQRIARRTLTAWFWADTRQQLPGLSLALMALLLALATNIGVGTMVSSFRLTFTGWLDQRLASELYVTARNETEAIALQNYLRPRSDAVLPIWNVEARIAGAPAEIYGVADHPTYRDNWPMLKTEPGVWDHLRAGSGILINEQLALRENLTTGDRINLPGAANQRISGIYSDYGNPVGQVLIGIDQFLTLFPDAEKRRFGVRISLQDAPALIFDLQQEFGLPAENIVDQATIKRFSLQVFERTFSVTAALNVLTLSIAAIAILTSLLTLASLRQPQLAPVWALGLTRRHLAALEAARALLLALFTVLAAIPLGLLLAYLLLNVINVEAFGWRIPMHLFPWDWGRLAVLSVLAALFAALWPALRLARTPPAALLKVFANER